MAWPKNFKFYMESQGSCIAKTILKKEKQSLEDSLPVFKTSYKATIIRIVCADTKTNRSMEQRFPEINPQIHGKVIL